MSLPCREAGGGARAWLPIGELKQRGGGQGKRAPGRRPNERSRELARTEQERE